MSTHYGNDPMGAPTQHRGLLENCPAPDCQDRVAEQCEWNPAAEQFIDHMAAQDPERLEADRAAAWGTADRTTEK